MERIVFKYVHNYFQTNNLIYKYQSGFLPGQSTVFQLIDIYNQICKAFDEHKSTCMVFCDISKAFDRVWHKGIIFKLRQFGVTGNILRWIQNYLSQRNQRVFIGNALSDQKIINAGVPQGSVLGPLLFLVYVNDIADSVLSTTRLFADDSSLAVSSNNPSYIETILNHDLEKISEWAKQWLVTFNPSKTEVVYFSLNNSQPPSLSFNSTNLILVEDHKHLGVTLSFNGTWHKHISNLVSSANKILGSMQILKFKLKRQTLNQIYISYLRPILEYASIVWDNCAAYEKERLERIQYEAARVVTGLTRSVSIENLLKEVCWPSLSDRRNIQKYVLMFKQKHALLPEYLSDIFPVSVGDRTHYNLRNNEDFDVPNQRTEIYSRSVIPSSIYLWNNLDEDTKNLPTLRRFKTKISSNFTPLKVPTYYYCGERIYSVHQTRMRNNCSNLKNDLYQNHLIDNPTCTCGAGPEDTEHYFFKCPLFINHRVALFRNTRRFHPLSAQKLLFGIHTLTVGENEILFKEVHTYIKNTKRFN